MQAKAVKAMGQTTELCAELEDIRIAQDWSYQQLAQAIEDSTNKHRNEDCWRRICLGLTPNPHGRTLAILKAFLASYKTQRRSSSGRRKAS
jgi:hypothetical protein